MVGPTAEQLFEAAAALETKSESLPLAIENYERVLELAPDWIDAHINKGVALYQLGRTDDAKAAFLAAVQLDPLNGISRYNLGCVLEEQGEIEDAIRHLRRAARAMPGHADVHFNLALAYEKKNERRLAREEWVLYLRYAPAWPLGGTGARPIEGSQSEEQGFSPDSVPPSELMTAHIASVKWRSHSSSLALRE